MDELKKQTTKSFAWNFLDKVGYQVISLLVGLVTLRLLSPTDFGYTGALAVFTMLSNILVESGFTAALIRRNNNSDRDYTAAFWFNLLLSVVLYLILFVSANAIATYFKMPVLTTLARVLFLAIIVNSFTIVQNIILQKELQFNRLTIANLTGMVVSGVITIWMAAKGYGYWALAAQQLSQLVVKAILLWGMSKWRPVRIKWSDFAIIKELFSFSAVLILSSGITTIVRYIYNVFIGPRYSTAEMGYYSQGYKYHMVLHNIVSSSISGVAYSVLAKLNGEPERQMQYIHKIVKMTAFITFPMMAGFFAIADNFVHVIVTDKWMPMVPYLRLLLIGGTTIPFTTLYINLFNVFGKPTLNFITELGRNILIIILLLLMNDSITEILYGYIISSMLAMAFASIVLKHVAKYRILDQIKHILPSLAMALVMAAAVYYIPTLMGGKAWLQLLVQLTAGGAIYAGLAKLFKFQILDDIICTLRKSK